MATNRVKMVDAVTVVATRLARNRSAILRVGTVTAVATNGFCTVNVGGGTVQANYLRADKPAVNAVVILTSDRDVWLILGTLSNGASDGTLLNGAWGRDLAMSWSNFTVTYTDCGVSATIVKQRPNTKLRVEVGGTFWTDVGADNGLIACVKLVSTGGQYFICEVRANTQDNAHMSFGGVTYLSGVAAGSQTIALQGRGQIASAGGPRMNSDDFAFVEVLETL